MVERLSKNTTGVKITAGWTIFLIALQNETYRSVALQNIRARIHTAGGHTDVYTCPSVTGAPWNKHTSHTHQKQSLEVHKIAFAAQILH